MKRFLTIAFLVWSSVAAVAVPLPQPRPIEIASLVQADPNFVFPDRTIQVQAAPQVTAPPVSTTPAVVAAPNAPIVVAAPPPNGLTEILAGINAAFLALIAGLLGFKKTTPATATATAGMTPVTDTSSIAAIVTSLLHTKGSIQDPTTRTAIDQALLGIIQSGIPGSALTTAAGLIPGAAPVASVLEPIVRNIVEQALEARMGNAGTAAAPTGGTVAVPAVQLTGIQDLLKELMGRMAANFPSKAA